MFDSDRPFEINPTMINKEDEFENQEHDNKSFKATKQSEETKWLHPLSEKVTLIKVIDQCFYEGHIVLENKVGSYVVFKFQQPKQCYSITPILYFIPPNESITINIKRFEKLELSSQIRVHDSVTIIAALADVKVEDVNDAKIFLRKEDIYSPEYQQYVLPLELDNGNNLSTYRTVIKERETILNEYNKQLNMNNITSCDEVMKHINKVKKSIKEYQKKINDLMSKLGDMNKNNVIKEPEVIFDKETFDLVYRKELTAFSKDQVPRSVLVVLVCVCLFIGKIIAMIS